MRDKKIINADKDKFNDLIEHPSKPCIVRGDNIFSQLDGNLHQAPVDPLAIIAHHTPNQTIKASSVDVLRRIIDPASRRYIINRKLLNSDLCILWLLTNRNVAVVLAVICFV